MPKTSIIKTWKGKKGRDGVRTNSQVCARPEGLVIARVRLICTRGKGSPDMDGSQAGLNRKRKFEKYVEQAESMYMKSPFTTALRRRLWGVRSQRRPFPAPVTAGFIQEQV